MTVLYFKMSYVIVGLVLLFSSGIVEAANPTPSTNNNMTTTTNTTSSSSSNNNNNANKADAGGRIVGGEDASIEDFPWQISLQDNLEGEYHFCGGSILSAWWIVTAAHCVEGRDEADLKVVSKITDLTESGAGHLVAKIIMHKRYNADTTNNDIALLKLSEPIVLDNQAAVVNLPVDPTAKNKALYTTGWGRLTAGGSLPDTLQKVVLYSMTNRKCRKSYDKSSITRRMLCAADAGKDSCQGDSGGPLVDTDTNTLVGITSWGYGCADPAYPGVYTRVKKFVKWINKKSNNLSDQEP